MLLNLSGILAIMGFIVWVVYRFRTDGATAENLKTQEAINEQDDELLLSLKKEKDFTTRLSRLTPDERRKLLNALKDPK